MTMECWILYDRADLEHNRFFAERLRDNGERLGMRTRVVTTDSVDGVPDLVVSRTRDWHISERLESLGAGVFNNSRTCRVCNDKLGTYRMAGKLGIPFLPCSVPGEDLPGGPPWVVKSRSGHGGGQVAMADDTDELADLIDRIPDPIIQQVAPVLGRDMRAYVLDGEVLACVMRSSEKIEKVVSELHPMFVGVDFVFGDRPYLNEVEEVVGTRMLYSLTDLDPARLLMECVHSKRSL